MRCLVLIRRGGKALGQDARNRVLKVVPLKDARGVAILVERAGHCAATQVGQFSLKVADVPRPGAPGQEMANWRHIAGSGVLQTRYSQTHMLPFGLLVRIP